MHLNMKLGLAKSLDALGILAVLRHFLARSRGTVLTFHRVLDEAGREQCYEPHLALSKGVFEDLLRLLRREFQVVSLDRIVESAGDPSSRPRVALTFDDGWADTYAVAFPLMMRYEVPATVFLCTGLMGAGHMLPEERFVRIWRACQSQGRLSQLLKDLANWGLETTSVSGHHAWARQIKTVPLETKLLMLSHLEFAYEVQPDSQRRLLTWEEAGIMQRNGIGFGSHTSGHSTLPTEQDAVVLRELETSRQALRQHLGVEARFLAYPNGMFDDRVIRLARRAGFSHGFTTERGFLARKTPSFTIPRLNIDDSVIIGRSSQLHLSRARLYLQPLARSIFGSRPQPAAS